jgi:hypothetical protein
VAYLVVCGFRGTIRVVSALFWLLVLYFIVGALSFLSPFILVVCARLTLVVC